MSFGGLVERCRNLQCPVTGGQIAAMVRAGYLHRDGQNVWADPAPDDVTRHAPSPNVTERHAEKGASKYERYVQKAAEVLPSGDWGNELVAATRGDLVKAMAVLDQAVAKGLTPTGAIGYVRKWLDDRQLSLAAPMQPASPD
jgi:hypothetical protein